MNRSNLRHLRLREKNYRFHPYVSNTAPPPPPQPPRYLFQADEYIPETEIDFVTEVPENPSHVAVNWKGEADRTIEPKENIPKLFLQQSFDVPPSLSTAKHIIGFLYEELLETFEHTRCTKKELQDSIKLIRMGKRELSTLFQDIPTAAKTLNVQESWLRRNWAMQFGTSENFHMEPDFLDTNPRSRTIALQNGSEQRYEELLLLLRTIFNAQAHSTENGFEYVRVMTSGHLQNPSEIPSERELLSCTKFTNRLTRDFKAPNGADITLFNPLPLITQQRNTNVFSINSRQDALKFVRLMNSKRALQIAALLLAENRNQDPAKPWPISYIPFLQAADGVGDDKYQKYDVKSQKFYAYSAWVFDESCENVTGWPQLFEYTNTRSCSDAQYLLTNLVNSEQTCGHRKCKFICYCFTSDLDMLTETLHLEGCTGACSCPHATTEFHARVGCQVSFEEFTCSNQKRSIVDCLQKLATRDNNESRIFGYKSLSPFALLHYTDPYQCVSFDEMHTFEGLFNKIVRQLEMKDVPRCSIFPSSAVMSDLRTNPIKITNYRFQAAKVMFHDILLIIAAENGLDVGASQLLARIRQFLQNCSNGIANSQCDRSAIIDLWKEHISPLVPPKLHQFLTHMEEKRMQLGNLQLLSTSYAEAWYRTFIRHAISCPQLGIKKIMQRLKMKFMLQWQHTWVTPSIMEPWPRSWQKSFNLALKSKNLQLASNAQLGMPTEGDTAFNNDIVRVYAEHDEILVSKMGHSEIVADDLDRYVSVGQEDCVNTSNLNCDTLMENLKHYNNLFSKSRHRITNEEIQCIGKFFPEENINVHSVDSLQFIDRKLSLPKTQPAILQIRNGSILQLDYNFPCHSDTYAHRMHHHVVLVVKWFLVSNGLHNSLYFKFVYLPRRGFHHNFPLCNVPDVSTASFGYAKFLGTEHFGYLVIPNAQSVHRIQQLQRTAARRRVKNPDYTPPNRRIIVTPSIHSTTDFCHLLEHQRVGSCDCDEYPSNFEILDPECTAYAYFCVRQSKKSISRVHSDPTRNQSHESALQMLPSIDQMSLMSLFSQKLWRWSNFSCHLDSVAFAAFSIWFRNRDTWICKQRNDVTRQLFQLFTVFMDADTTQQDVQVIKDNMNPGTVQDVVSWLENIADTPHFLIQSKCVSCGYTQECNSKLRNFSFRGSTITTSEFERTPLLEATNCPHCHAGHPMIGYCWKFVPQFLVSSPEDMRATSLDLNQVITICGQEFELCAAIISIADPVNIGHFRCIAKFKTNCETQWIEYDGYTANRPELVKLVHGEVFRVQHEDEINQIPMIDGTGANTVGTRFPFLLWAPTNASSA